ncbi:MAG: recombination mediator RecR [Myxococcota bacterium]|nr:recombination mediator RecR [Myxococcota bacterium]
MTTNALDKAVSQLSRFPGIGERTASRMIYWLLRQEPETAVAIGTALCELPTTVRRCAKCFTICSTELCRICSSPKRSAEIICVVERPQDIDTIETTGEFNGTYHVLDGALSPLQGVGPDQLRIRELLKRLQPDNVNEVLVACDPDTEGDATAMYLATLIKPLGVTVTRLAHGIAVGTELEYANKSSVMRALANKHEL